jgi:phosphoribosylglycinamide formyltransferase-1
MKRVCIINEKRETVRPILTLSGCEVEFVKSVEEIQSKNFDVVCFVERFEDVPEDILSKSIVLNSHLSLLPAFPTSTPVKDAYLGGVKVTGVTISQLKQDKNIILAQYPVLIDCYTNYSQLEYELIELEKKMYPLVIKSILEDKVFDIVDMLSASSSHACGGCGKCHN